MSSHGESRVRESFGRQAFMRTLGATLEEIGDGSVAIRLPGDPPKHLATMPATLVVVAA